MPFYENEISIIFFGDASTCLNPETVRGKKFDELFLEDPWAEIKKTMKIKTGVFGHQVHGVTGQRFDANSAHLLDQPLFVKESDYLVTDLCNCGLGIVTADCLPLVLIDNKKKIVSVIHAGWKGLTNGIVKQVINEFQKVYGSSVANLRLFVGPSAGACCYEVGYHFLEENKDKQLPREVFYEKSGTLFFDMKALLSFLSRKEGLLESQIEKTFSDCTICTPTYCSFRRNNKAPERQLTIVALK